MCAPDFYLYINECEDVISTTGDKVRRLNSTFYIALKNLFLKKDI